MDKFVLSATCDRGVGKCTAKVSISRFGKNMYRKAIGDYPIHVSYINRAVYRLAR